jgi:SAM-dependent methyltransferase
MLNDIHSILKLIILFVIFTFIFGTNYAQEKSKNRPYQCGFVISSFRKLKDDFNSYTAYLGCQKNEIIADVGSLNGRIPVEVSVFVDSITWYVQDIDTSCLNTAEFQKVLDHHRKLKKGPINGAFHLVIGDNKKTNLPLYSFDRVLLINVYHELEFRAEILIDIKKILKSDGVLVVMERMGKDRNEIHGDCKMHKLFEPDFISEMESFDYFIESKTIGEVVSNLIYYTFRLKQINENTD